MATEIDIPVSVKGEREDDAFSSEFLEGKVTDHPGNKVKQLETGLNQSLETSSCVAETVNTQLESDKRTDEGGIFFQALAVPMAMADEHIKTQDSCETSTTEDQEDRSGASKIEALTEEKPNDDEQVAVVASKETEDKSVDAQEVKEVCAASEKVESEKEVKLSDSSSTKLQEKATTILNKDDDQEKEQEVNMSEKSQGEDNITSSRDLTFESSAPELVETKEITEKDTQEIEYNVETLEKTERLIHTVPTDVCISTQTEPEEKTHKNDEKNEEEVIDSNDDQTKKYGSLMVKEVSKKVESEEVSNLQDDSSMGSNENVIASKEDQDKLYVLEKGQGGGDDVISSQNASREFIKETTTDRQEESEKSENEAKDKRKQKLEESVNKIVHSSLEIEQEDDTEEIKPSDEKLEQQGSLHVISADASNSTQTESHESAEHKVNYKEATIESDEGVKFSDNSSMKQNEEPVEILNKNEDQETEYELNAPQKDEAEDDATCSQDSTSIQEKKYHEGTTKENEEKNDEEGIEREGLIHSDSSSMVLNENEIVGKDKYQEKEQQFYTSENDQRGGDDVTGSQNASSEDIKEMISQHATKVAYFEEVQGLNAMAKDIHKEDGTDGIIVPQEASEQYENGANSKREQKPEEIMHSCLDIEQEEYAKEIKPSVETGVKEEQEGLMGISSETETRVESQLESTKHEEEVIESDDSQKEKSSNPSITEVCEEINAGKVEYEGVQLSDDSSVKLNEKAIAILSKEEDQENELSIKDLEGKNYDGEHIEPELVEHRESIKKDIEVTRANVDIEEIKEQQGSLSAIVTDVCKSAQTEPKEETRKNEESIESHDGREEKLVIPCVNEACEETSLESIDAQEASERYENEAKDKREQDLEESANKPEHSHSEIGEAAIKEHETNEGNKEEAYFEKSKFEAGDETECKTAGETQNISPENKYDAIADESKSTENPCTTEQDILEEVGEKTTPEEITKQASQESQSETNKEIEDKLYVEEYQAGGREAGSEMKDETILIENVSTELEQPMEQNVEENQACRTTTMKEKIEDEVAKKDEDLSLGSIEVFDDNTVKEEKSSLDGKTREIEISTLYHETVEEKTTTKLEEITKQAFQESQSETNKEIEAKLDAGNQANGREDESETKDEVVLTEKMSSELGQPMEQNVEEIQACGTTTMSEKIEDDIAEKIEDLSLGSIEDKNDNGIKEKESFLDERTKEIEISTLEHAPVGEKTMEPEDITEQVFQESQIETYKDIEAKLGAECQAGRREDKSEMKDDVVMTKETSSELGQLVEQNAEEIHACRTTTMSEKIEDDIAEKNENLSHGSIEDKDDNTVKEEKSFLDGKTREIETATLEHEPVGEKTTTNSEEITKQAFQESEVETNKEIDTKLDAENQAGKREDRRETKDEVVLTEKISLELEQPMEQNVKEIDSCQTTTVSGKIEDEITIKIEDLSLGNIEDKDDSSVKEEKSFLDEKTREIEIFTLEHEPIEEKTTTKSEEITKQDFQESEIETNKEIDTKLDVENQANEREDRREIKDEVVLTEKMSFELGQPVEQHVEEIHACQTTTMNENIEDEIAKKDEDLALGSIEVANDNTIKEEKNFLNGRTREIEISAFEHEPVDEKTTIKSEEITKQAFQKSQSETNKETEAKLDTENQENGREDRSEMNDEVVLAKEMSSELGQPMEQNVEEIQACQTTTLKERIEDEIAKKNEDLSLGSIEVSDDNTIKEEKSLLDGRTREIEISAFEHESVGEKTTIKPEEITKKAFQESEIETNKEIEAKLDAENQANGREDESETKDEVVLTEKLSLELEQPMEQNVQEIHSCRTTTMNENTEDGIAKKNEDLSLGNIKVSDDNTIKEEKNLLDGKTREIEISTLKNEPVGEKTTMNPVEITKQAFQESQIETNKEIEARLDAENQADEKEDRSEMKDEVVLNEKISSELEQPMEQNVEEIHSCQTTTVSGKIEDAIAEKNEDLTLGTIEDKDDNTVKEEKSFLDEKTREIEIFTLEHEPVEEKTTTKSEEFTKQAFQESEIETNKEVDTKLDAENQADEREDRREMKDVVVLTEKMSLELEQPMEQHVEKIQAYQTTTMNEKIEDEVAKKDEDLALGSIEVSNDNTINEAKSFLNGRTRETEISVLEHEPVGEKTTIKPEEITKQAAQESQSEPNKETEANLDVENQVDEREDKNEMKDEVVLTEKIPSELEQPMEQNIKKIQACQTKTMSEKTEYEIVENEDLSHDSAEDSNENTANEEKSFLNGRTREIKISTLEHEPVEEKNGGLDEVPKKKHTDLNEATTVELQKDFIPSISPGTSTDNTPNSENLKAESENLPIEDLDSVSEVQIPRTVPNSEDSNVKEEFFISATTTAVDEERGTVTKETSSDEISYTDPIPVENPEVTKLIVDTQIGQEDLHAAEDINCESKSSSGTQVSKTDMNKDAEKSVRISEEVKNYGVEEAPKQERIPILEDAATLEPQVNQSKLESTYPSESDKSQALESVCDVQIPEVVADSKESKVKEERIDLATAEYADENNGDEEQEIKTNEISSVEKKEHTTETKQVVEPHSMLCRDAVLIEKNLELHGELKPASELMIDEDQVDETKPQPEQSDITSEQVVVETGKEEGSTEVKQQDFEEDNCPTELEKTSTSNQKELANEIEFSKSIPIGNAKVAELEAESERELKNIPEELSCLSKASSTAEVKDDSVDEASRTERVPNLEGAKALELQVNLPEIESIDTPSNDQDDRKLRESMLIEQKGVLSSQLTDREILEEQATENRKEAPNHEFEKDEKDDRLISEIQTPEANLKMEIKEEHLEATNDSYETVKGGLSSEKKLVSMVPPEELTSPKAEDQTNELVSETDKTKVDSSVSSKDWNPELMDEKFTKTLSEDQRSMKEKYIEEEGQDNFGAESKEAKSGNEVVEDGIVNEVLLEVEKAKESDNINKEGSFIPNHLTSTADEVCQIERLNSSSNELLEVKGSVEDIGDLKLMAETPNLRAETVTVMEGPNIDMKQNVEETSETVASEFESSKNMVTEEKMIEADANKERKTSDEPREDDAAKTTSDSISSSTEQDNEAKSEEISGHADVHKLEEEPTKAFELTPEVDEIVEEGKKVSAMLTENLQEASPKMLLVKQDPETTTTIEKSEEEIKDKDENLVNMDFSTSSKEVACLSNEKAGELQVSTSNAEDKQDGPGDMLDKEREAVQPQEHISDIKSVDPASDVEISEQGELVHCGSQEPSEDNALLSQNDKKNAYLLVVPSVQNEIMQCVDRKSEEAPAIDNQKHENNLDYTANEKIVDVVNKAESQEIEQYNLDTREATVEPINEENQSEQKKEDENIESEIPIEKVAKQTAAHEEIANEFLVMPVAKEEEKSNYLQDYSKEEEHSGKKTYQDLEAVMEPSQTDKLSDKVKKAEPIDTQEETMAEGNLHEKETEKRTNITETTVNLHHGEKSDETNCKATSTEAAIPIEYVKSSNMVRGDLDAAVPKCASTRNPEVRSAILEVRSVIDATNDKAGYNKDPNNKTAEAHVAEKGVLNEDVHLESTSDISKSTDKISETNQEPFNLSLTKERSMELDAPVKHGTASTEHVENSQKYVKDDLIKTSQIQPELQKDEVSACAVDKQLPGKPYQNESTESKLLTGIDASHEQGEPTAKSLNAKAKDLEATNASGTEPQCSSEVVKEEKKISDEKENPETPERATQANSKVAENLIEERELAPTKDEQVEKEETGDNGAKTDEDDEAEEDDEDNQKIGSCSDAPVMIEASKDMEVKVPKKSHNILSGVGSKVKHSIAKVKKAITGKSSSPKPPSPKKRD